jgi:hypothetical protein
MASCRAFASASLGRSGCPIAVARIGPLPSTTRMTNGWILSPSAPGTNAGIRAMPISQVPPGLVPKPLGRCRGGAMAVIAIAPSCRRCWWPMTANPGHGWCRWTLNQHRRQPRPQRGQLQLPAIDVHLAPPRPRGNPGSSGQGLCECRHPGSSPTSAPGQPSRRRRRGMIGSYRLCPHCICVAMWWPVHSSGLLSVPLCRDTSLDVRRCIYSPTGEQSSMRHPSGALTYETT